MLQEIPNKKHIFVAVAVEIPFICKRFLNTDLFNFHSISNIFKRWEIWTLDLLFVRETLWPAELSAFSERRDLNPKPPIPKIGALPNYELLSVLYMLGKRFELLTFSFSGKRSKPTELPKQIGELMWPFLPRGGQSPPTLYYFHCRIQLGSCVSNRF